jgi:uncharacterized membrane protein YdfJ with MMPL/SSD domain
MKQICWMIGAGAASCAAIGIFLPRQTGLEVMFGMLGPLAAAVISLMLAQRTWERRPEAMTRLMIASFGAKLMFFGVYVAVMLRVLMLTPMPFVLSFAGYFIVLYLIEALLLKRLLGRGMHSSR